MYTFLVLLLNTKIKLSLSLPMLFHLCTILTPQWLNWNIRDCRVMSPLDAHNWFIVRLPIWLLLLLMFGKSRRPAQAPMQYKTTSDSQHNVLSRATALLACLGFLVCWFFFWIWEEIFRHNWVICICQEESQGPGIRTTAGKHICFSSLWREGCTACSCWGLHSTSFPHVLLRITCWNMQPNSFPGYMVFCCHESPCSLSLFLLCVLPTGYEEQVPYNCPAFKTITQPRSPWEYTG